MKKALSLILALVMCLSLCACGGNKGIELTLDNYDDYLEINVEDDYHETLSYQGIHCRTGVSFIANVTGVSSNYNYDNVTVKVHVHGSYQSVFIGGAVNYETETFDTILEVDTNVSGSGKVESITFQEEFDGMVGRGIAGYADFQYEVIEVSGTVTPA